MAQKKETLLEIIRKRIQDKLRSILMLLCKFLLTLDVCAVLVSSSLKKNTIAFKKA